MSSLDTSLTDAQRKDLERLRENTPTIEAPEWLRARSPIDFESETQRAAEDAEAFWAEKALALHWESRWIELLRFESNRPRWFVGGKINAAVNCIDRHVYSNRRNQAALIWVSEDGDERTYTYNRLYREVNRFANALRGLSVGPRDGVIIVMPLVPECVITMLACARIGAVHVVCDPRIPSPELARRIVDTGAKVVVCSDTMRHGGQAIAIRPGVEAAIDAGAERATIEHLVLHRSGSRPNEIATELADTTPDGLRAHDWYGFQATHEIHCQPEIVEANHPLFILYGNASNQAVTHATGGYLCGVSYSSRAFYQIEDRDIFWGSNEIATSRGHGFTVYGPLSIGATVLVREGAVDHPSPDVTWELCERFGVNVMASDANTLQMAMRHGPQVIDKYDLSRLRLIASAGTPLDAETHRWAQTHLVAQADGMVINAWWPEDFGGPVLGTTPSFASRPGWTGRAMPGVIARIISGTREDIGELVVERAVPYLGTRLRGVEGDPGWIATEGTPVYRSGLRVLRGEDGWFAVLPDPDPSAD